MDAAKLILDILDEGYEKKTWHGPNLKQAIKGVTVELAAWRPGKDRHNIWEETVHAAYWKYAVRRRIEGGKRGSFALPGSNFFVRPEVGKNNEKAWRTDRELLQQEHLLLRAAVVKALKTRRANKLSRMLYGVALHRCVSRGADSIVAEAGCAPLNEKTQKQITHVKVIKRNRHGAAIGYFRV
jgi:hypothetical protein